MTALSKDGIVWAVAATGATISSSLSWRASDPFAIKITFHSSSEGDIVWYFARDLVTEAFANRFAGSGDFRIEIRDGKFMLWLRSSFVIELMTDAEPIRDFVQRTCAVVPPGKEDQSDVVDEFIRKALEDV